jgi:hypothetical protein
MKMDVNTGAGGREKGGLLGYGRKVVFLIVAGFWLKL